RCLASSFSWRLRTCATPHGCEASSSSKKSSGEMSSSRRRRGMTSHVRRIRRRGLDDAAEVFAVRALAQAIGGAQYVVGCDGAEVIGDFFGAGDFQSLAQLDGLDEIRGLQQRLLRSRIEPRVAAAELLDSQRMLLEINAIEIGDLELSARRRFQIARDLAHLLVVEVQAGDGEVRARLRWLFFNGHGAAVIVE